jgi:murein DD-endopeptidase MepM/ murein hydrolase activator NlpD
MGQAIYAADTGVVVFAGWSDRGYGDLVIIDHLNGFHTFYAHLSQWNVSCGQQVYAGSIIGLGGSTGNSTGPHLHFEILDNGNRVDPHYYLS